MGQTVYVDLFFMINFSMDFLCFFLVFELLGNKMSLWRALLSSALGGIYANVALFIQVEGIFAILIDIAVCVLMCFIAFGKRNSLVLHTFVYIAISMALGGFMTALFSLFNKMELPLSEVEDDGISAYLLVILAIISAVGTLFGGKLFKKRASKKYTDVSIFFGNNSKTLSAFCDSGNLLHDPISGRPCIIVDADALNGIIPDKIIKNAKERNTNITLLPEDMIKRIRLIPTRTATGEGLMLGLKADKILIGEKGKTKEVNALLALCELGKTAEGCQALISTELII